MKTIYIFLACLFLFACNKEEFAPEPEVLSVGASQLHFSNPYNFHLKRDVNKKLVERTTNQPFTIILADSPEPRFKYRNTSELDTLVKYGINTITATIYGGDVTDIHPYNAKTRSYNGKTFGNPSSGFNRAFLLAVRSYILHFAAITNGKYLVIIYTSEKENHFAITENEHKQMFDTLYAYLGDLSIMWQNEEFPTGRSSWIRNVKGYQKSVDQNNLISLHCNTNDQSWGSDDEDILDCVGLQANLSTIASQGAKAFNNGYAWYAHEEQPGGFGINDTTNLKSWALAGNNTSSGAGNYDQSYDLQQPTASTAHARRNNYRVLSRVLINRGTVTPPDTTTPTPIGNIIIEYSKVWNKNPAYLLNNGANLSVGGYWIFVRTGTPTFSFTLTRSGSPGTLVNTSDSSAPFDMMANGNKYLSRGSYTLKAKDGNGQEATRAFTVQ